LGSDYHSFTTEVSAELYDINNRRLRTQGTVTYKFKLARESHEDKLTQEFIIVDGISEEVVLGLDALYGHKFMFDGREQTIYRLREPGQFLDEPVMIIAREIKIPPHTAQVVESERGGGKLPLNVACFFHKAPELPAGLRIDPFVSEMQEEGLFRLVVVNTTHQTITLPRFQVLGRVALHQSHIKTTEQIASCISKPKSVDPAKYDSILQHIQPEDASKIRTLLEENSDAFASETKELGCTGLVKHTIDTQGQGPIRLRPYRTSPRQREVANKIIDELLENQIIQPSTSPWSAPIVLVKKKTGEDRLCIDYRRLNAITKKDSFPLPRIDDVFDLLQGQRFFSTLDLASGYWQIEMDAASKEKTAFIVDNNVYEWNRLAFGLTNAPGTFQRLMNHVLRKEIGKSCLVYLDDIIVFSKTIEEHVENLRRIFALLKEANLKLNLIKCKFLAEVVHYLGHVITAEGTRPDPEKIEKIANYKKPETSGELLSFLGLASYYRRFINNFSTVAHPLIVQSKLDKREKVKWGPEEDKSFEILKKCLTSPPILAFPDFRKEFILFTDASDYGVGAVLSQIHDGKEVVIAYASRHLDKDTLKYSTIEKEAYAIVFGVDHFRHYLQDEPFTIVSDHRPLQWLQTVKDEKGRLGRWAILLSNLKYTIKYRPGRVNGNADFLSRIKVAAVQAIPRDNDVMHEEQQKDPLCKSIMTYLEDGILFDEDNRRMPIWAKEIELYFMANGILCRTLTPVSKKRRQFVQIQVVVPLSLRKMLLQEYHDSPTAGHLAYKRTCLRLRDKFYWPTMLDDIKEYCKACEACALQRRVHLKTFLNPLDLTSAPFEVLGLDFLGPIQPASLEGNNYVLVITDYFTKWVEVIPLPDQTALTTSKAMMERIILYHGPPKAIVTDRGTNFTSELFNHLCRALHIKHRTTTAYHPQSNGLTERFNKTVVEMLRKYLNDGYTNWEEMLGAVAFAYRNSVHSSTNETPYFLNHGRDPAMPLDRFFKPPQQFIVPPKDYTHQTMKRLYDAFELVRANLQAARDQQKAQYDVRAKKLQYHVGDKVLLDVRAWKRGTSRKLNPRYKGPYRVKKVNSNETVEIQEVGGKQTQLVHVNRIKPLYETMIWKDEPCVEFFDVRTGAMNGEEEEIPPPTEETTEAVRVRNKEHPVVRKRGKKKKKRVIPFPGINIYKRPTFVIAPRPGRRPGLRSAKFLEQTNIPPENNKGTTPENISPTPVETIACVNSPSLITFDSTVEDVDLITF
jgi:hypothetical protein